MSEIIISIIGTIGTLGGGLFALIKSGYIQVGKTNGNGAGKLAEIDEHLELLTSNHISHVQKGIDDLKEGQADLISGQKDIIKLLGELKEYGIKIRKE